MGKRTQRITKDYNPVDYIYNDFSTDEQEKRNERLSGNVRNMRTKEIESGEQLEIDMYPIYDRGVKQVPKSGKTREVQRELNATNTRKKIVRICNANFGYGDIWATLKYTSENNTTDFAELGKNAVNYFRRIKRIVKAVNEHFEKLRQVSFLGEEDVKRYTSREYDAALFEFKKGKRIKANLKIISCYLAQVIDEPMPELKYICVTEIGQSGNAHHHFITNFRFRAVLESAWRLGKNEYTRRVVPDEDFGIEGLARYISKDRKYRDDYQKHYTHSKNLVLPWNDCMTYDDEKNGVKDAAQLAKMWRDENHAAARAWYETNYPGYRFLDFVVKTNDYCGGYYIYARMRREGA